jgi:hypothetical protein
METVYFENSYLTLYHDPARQRARAVWTGFLSGEVFRSNVGITLRFLEDKNPLFWLADNRKMKAIRQKDQDWFGHEILPRLGVSSIKRMATLVSEDLFNQMAVEALFTRANQLIRFDHQFFKTEQEALDWLTTAQSARAREA